MTTSSPDSAECEALLRRGSKSFYAASRLLPARLRKPTAAVYAFCRLSDDAVDVDRVGAEAIDRLRMRLARIYDGVPFAHPVDRAFADVVETYSLPKRIPEALLEGMQWDVESRQYESLSDLYSYCARVASTVGVMMTLLMGKRCPHVLARACDLGVAMQLTNIARDVGEDARNGRLYLPLSWMRASGLEPVHFLAHPVFDLRLAVVVERVLRAADALYERAHHGIRSLPKDCRLAILSARKIYADIGRNVRRAGHDSVNHRAYTSLRTKLGLIVQSAATLAWLPQARLEEPPLDEAVFLINATQLSSVPIANEQLSRDKVVSLR